MRVISTQNSVEAILKTILVESVKERDQKFEVPLRFWEQIYNECYYFIGQDDDGYFTMRYLGFSFLCKPYLEESDGE